MTRFSVVILVLAVTAFRCEAVERPEVAGFYLGMTESQVNEELKKKGVNPPYSHYVVSFNYGDGVNLLKTEERLHTLNPWLGSDQIVLQFSQAPGEQKVISIARRFSLPNPPTKPSMVASLKSKYGEPSDHTLSGNDDKYVWGEPGKLKCWETGKWSINGTNYGEIWFPDLTIGALQRAVAQNGNAQLDVKTCGYAVYAKMNPTDPVTELEVTLADFGAAVRDRFAINAMLEELTAKATEKRINSGKTPDL